MNINLYFKLSTQPPTPPKLQALSPKQNINRPALTEPTPQTLPKPLSTRSLKPLNRKRKSLKLELRPPNPKPHNHPTGEEGPHTPHHRKGVHPVSGPLTFGGGRGGGARSA